jgi:SAM-dependent methyltransferase
MKFWNKEYKKPTHLALSTEPSEDLEKFTRWLERNYGRSVLNQTTMVLDLGCGNGRNLVYLAKNFGCHGVGYDSSSEAIAQAHIAARSFFQALGKASQPKAFLGSSEKIPRTLEKSPVAPLKFEVRSIKEPISLPDNSVNVVLDMMSSHILKDEERKKFRDEIVRVLKPSGWLLFKTFLLEEDDHAKRLLREHPADESNSYIHPKFGHYEHVWVVPEIEQFFGQDFEISKIEKSHKHRSHGHAFRRRTMTVYLEKKQ